MALLASALQGGDPRGAKLVLAPSEPLTEPVFKKPARPAPGAEAAGEPRVRRAILELKPAGDPIYLDEEVQDDWRTYSVPKVEAFSRDGEGVGLQGYDVVSYTEEHAEKGKKGFPAAYGGVTWYFASGEHRDLFVKDPGRFLPAYGGFCAYSIAKGYPVTADPRTFVMEGGTLYLFFDKAVQALWEQDRNRLVSEAGRRWPKLHR